MAAGKAKAKEARIDRMSIELRRSEILKIIDQDGSVSVQRIRSTFGVSEVTARNDLAALAKQGHVRRVRGGACAVDSVGIPSDPALRLNVNAEAKVAIARAAAEFVEDGDRIVVDAGTTTLEFVKALAGKQDLTITTYDLDIALYADAHLPNVEVTMPGGTLQKNRRYLAGPLVTDNLARFYFDKVFLGADTFSSRQGFGTKYMASAAIKESMIKHARYKYMLLDASKVGRTSPVRFSTIEDLDVIVIDHDPEDTVRLSIDALALNAIVKLVQADEQ